MRSLRLPTQILLVSALALAGGCGKREKPEPLAAPDFILQETGELASEANPQVISGNRFEDYYYSFTLERPNSNWEFFTAEKAASINADAVMGMAQTENSVHLLVVVDSMPGMTLAGYGDIIFSPDGHLGIDGKPGVAGKIGGLDALSKETAATIAGTPFYYRVSVVQRGDFFYQLIGYTIESNYPGVKDEVEAIIASFRPVEDREPTIRANLNTTDDVGFGWRIEDGVHSNAASGFRMPAPEGCRLMGKAEIAQSNPEASLGIAGGFSEFFQYWFIESAAGGEALQQYYLKQTAEASGGEVVAQRAVKVGDLDATEFAIEGGTAGGAPLQVRLTMLERNGSLYRLWSHWQSVPGREPEVLLDRCYAAATWLSGPDQAALTSEFYAAGHDPGNAVGSDFALRKRTFYDFAGGYLYHLPEGAFFETVTGATAPVEGMEGNRLLLTNIQAGSYVQVSFEPGAPDDHQAYHASMVEHSEERQPTVTQEVGSNEFLITHYSSQVDEAFYSHVYATCAGAENYFELWLTRVGDRDGADADEVDALLGGLEWPRRKLEREAKTPKRFTDNRLGFRLDTAGWEATPSGLGELDSMGSFVLMEKPKAAAGAIVMCSPLGLDLDSVSHAMLRRMGIDFDGATREHSRSTLAGLPADLTLVKGRDEGTGKKVTVHIWIARRANTGYVFFLVSEGTVKTDSAAKLAEALELLD